MLEVSEEALKHLQNVGGEDNTGVPIRVAVMGSGATNCGLGLMIDEMTENDTSFIKGDFTVIVDTKLMDYCKTITIDFAKGEADRCDSRSKRGFTITAENPVNF
ncbi:hypothetical protein [Desulfosediminicola flagellatus]|uniref:hypothetical protein n=1 Tax=Desulfosediminicola flagellatus TaxID=2569541 RepID=UPI0010ACDC59|nr:hypothetical protein [Desulfosediminicola flagellatus]